MKNATRKKKKGTERREDTRTKKDVKRKKEEGAHTQHTSYQQKPVWAQTLAAHERRGAAKAK
jgi:hypothetical protein